MNSLNTDCLIEIIKLLNLKDQISASQVSTSLQVAVTSLWLIKYKHVRINFMELDLTNKEFFVLLKNVQKVVETLQLRFLNKEKFEVMKEFCLAGVTDFRFTLSKPYFIEDSHLKDLRKVLPNLKALSPHGHLTGLYMDEWPLLKELNLSFCFQLEMLELQKILSRLKLEKLKLNIFPNNNQFEQMNLMDAQVEDLKYLELNTYEFYYFLAKPLTALKELIITNHYNPRQLFDVLLSIWQAKDIRLVETANVDNILVSCIEMHLNIEQLTIINDENALPSNIIPSLHLLTALRRIRFKCCQIRSKDFINLLKNTPQIHEISFENCQFDVAQFCLKASEIYASNRLKKLHLNMFQNRLIDDVERPIWLKGMDEVVNVSVNVEGDQSFLKLTNCKGDDLRYEPLYAVYR